MLFRFKTGLLVANLVQLGLLASFYTDPASRVVPAAICGAILVLNSGLLLILAY